MVTGAGTTVGASDGTSVTTGATVAGAGAEVAAGAQPANKVAEMMITLTIIKAKRFSFISLYLHFLFFIFTIGNFAKSYLCVRTSYFLR
jgi:hypothetical protein